VSVSRDNLLLLILADLRQHFVVVIFALFLLLSAFYNILLIHETRELATQKELLAQQKDNLMTEWQNLLIEEHTLDEHSRIRHIAKTKLSMAQPTKHNTVLVEVP
jgi:cell division protein FtsL